MNKRLEEIFEKKATEAGVKVNEVDPEMQIDGAGMRALADEMKDRIGRNNTARHQSEISARDSFVS